jgi:hypothetical protein
MSHKLAQHTTNFAEEMQLCLTKNYQAMSKYDNMPDEQYFAIGEMIDTNLELPKK